MDKTLYAWVAALFLLTSCSSYHYTKGTECIEAGDYIGAIDHLEEAIRVSPDDARNYTNAGYAYIQIGNYEKAWIYMRQACFANYSNEKNDRNAKQNLMGLWLYLQNKHQIKEDSSFAEIENALGAPDYTVWVKKIGCEPEPYQVFYGFLVFHFENGKLIRVD